MNVLGQLPSSINVYLGLILVLTVLGAVNAFLPQGSFTSMATEQQIPASRPVMALVTASTMLILYGGLGFIGLQLAQKVGVAALWDAAVSNHQRFVLPALAGVGTGVFFIVADFFLKSLHPLGALPHPPFPTSLVASAVAGIGEEVIFRLFFIPLWTWLVSTVLLQGRYESEVFWGVAAFSALAFAVSHVPMVTAAFGMESASEMPLALTGE